MLDRARQHLDWLLGFLVTANLYLVPTLASSPRATDLLGLALSLWALRRLAAGRLPLGPLALLLLVDALPAGWMVMSLLDPDPPTTVQSLRWLVAIPWALALTVWLEDEASCRRFAWGLLWGGGVNVAVILAQYAGLEPVLRLFGLSSTQSTFFSFAYNVVRIPGLHGSANPSSAVVSLVVPASLYLYFRKQAPLVVPVAALAGFLLALNLTSTRSPLAVAALTLGYAFVAARQYGRATVFALMMVAILVPAYLTFGPPGGRSRWEDATALQVNVRERMHSNVASLDLALSHPLGMGVTRGKDALYDRSGIRATHDAYLQAAMDLGLPLALMIALAVLVHVARGLATGGGTAMLTGLLAFHVAGLFFFEEHLNNPTFVILASWFIASAVRAVPMAATQRSG